MAAVTGSSSIKGMANLGKKCEPIGVHHPWERRGFKNKTTRKVEEQDVNPGKSLWAGFNRAAFRIPWTHLPATHY